MRAAFVHRDLKGNLSTKKDMYRFFTLFFDNLIKALPSIKKEIRDSLILMHDVKIVNNIYIIAKFFKGLILLTFFNSGNDRGLKDWVREELLYSTISDIVESERKDSGNNASDYLNNMESVLRDILKIGEGGKLQIEKVSNKIRDIANWDYFALALVRSLETRIYKKKQQSNRGRGDNKQVHLYFLYYLPTLAFLLYNIYNNNCDNRDNYGNDNNKDSCVNLLDIIFYLLYYVVSKIDKDNVKKEFGFENIVEKNLIKKKRKEGIEGKTEKGDKEKSEEEDKEKDSIIFLYLLIGCLSYIDRKPLIGYLDKISINIDLGEDKVFCKEELARDGNVKELVITSRSDSKNSSSNNASNNTSNTEKRCIDIEEFLKIMLECWIKKVFCFKGLNTDKQGGN